MHAAQHRPQSAADPFNALDVLVPDGMRKRLLARAEPWRLRHAALSARRRLPALRSVCLLVRTIVAEMVMLTGDPGLRGRDRRFALAHIQQISVYVCHVVLQMTMSEIGTALGRDRATVGDACARVEDRRDDGAYDLLVAAVERVIGNLFGAMAEAGEEGAWS